MYFENYTRLHVYYKKCYPEMQLIAAYTGQNLSISGVKPFVTDRACITKCIVAGDRAGQGDGRYGACQGCQRDSCRECSACKRGHFEGCIDKYCSERQEGGRLLGPEEDQARLR